MPANRKKYFAYESKQRPFYLIDEINGERMIYTAQFVPTERNTRKRD